MVEQDGHEHLQQKYIQGRTLSVLFGGRLRRDLLALLAGRL